MGRNKVFFKMTYRQMKESKVRTLVTIIGIILSAALITAIATFVSSLQNSMLEYKISEQGNWHGVIRGVANEETVKEISTSKEIKKSFFAHNLGYTKIAEPEEKSGLSYLNVMAVENDFMENMPIVITSGRMAENSGEIVLCRELFRNQESQSYQLGDTIVIPLGVRKTANGGILSQANCKIINQQTNNEILEVLTQERTLQYTIVGFCEKPSYIDYHDYQAFAYPAFTKYDENSGTEYSTDIYFRMKNANDVHTFVSKYAEGNVTETNEYVLPLLGTSKYSSYYSFVYALATIVIVLVMGGSVLLIFNSFAISINERTRQFGLLSSIGATKAQLRSSVLYEVFLVSIVGIPAGVFTGIIGIWVTLFCIRGSLKNIAASVISLGEMRLHVSGMAIIIAAAASLITVLISAFIPMIRISRLSAVQAIRQNADIKLSRRKVKCSRLFIKLFGFEGMIGRKNFKRSRKKYRTTVVSLFVSIVLFISASALGHYLIASIEGVYRMGDYDISYRLSVTEEADQELAVLTQLKESKYVTKAGTARVESYTQIVKDSYYTQEYLDYIKKNERAEEEDYLGNTVRFAKVYGVEDDIYKEYLQKNGLSVDQYMDIENPSFLIYSNCRVMDSQTGKSQDIMVYKPGTMQLSLYQTDWKKYDQVFTELQQENQNSEDSERQGEISRQAEEASKIYYTWNAEVTDCVPFTVEMASLENYDYILCSKSMLDKLEIGQEEVHLLTFFKTTDHAAATEEMQKILKENNMNYQYALTDEAMEYESRRSMIFVVKVFSYGFFVMMSLIAMANVFNTISTNMMLRRREFAMLKSVGLTGHSFNKMLYYECIMYGSKALVLGIPVSLAVVWWVYHSVNDLWVMGFELPWAAIIISVISVYFIVFVTMIYSKKKIQKLNLIACIKEENI